MAVGLDSWGFAGSHACHRDWLECTDAKNRLVGSQLELDQVLSG
jgi:hypothetical protein